MNLLTRFVRQVQCRLQLAQFLDLVGRGSTQAGQVRLAGLGCVLETTKSPLLGVDDIPGVLE